CAGRPRASAEIIENEARVIIRIFLPGVVVFQSKHRTQRWSAERPESPTFREFRLLMSGVMRRRQQHRDGSLLTASRLPDAVWSTSFYHISKPADSARFLAGSEYYRRRCGKTNPD